MTNSPACWTRVLGRQEYEARFLGDTRNDLWRRNWLHWVGSLGKKSKSNQRAAHCRTKEMRTSDSGLKGPGAALRDGIPELGCAKVDVIDAEQVHIFDVPSKRRSPHAKVEVRGINAWQALRGGREEAS